MATACAELQTQLHELAKQTSRVVRPYPYDRVSGRRSPFLWVSLPMTPALMITTGFCARSMTSSEQMAACRKSPRRQTIYHPHNAFRGCHMNTPTAEGLRRYPHTTGFQPDIFVSQMAPDLTRPCCCSSACAPRCSGTRRCDACSLAFNIFVDEAGYLSVDPMTAGEEAEAIARYEGV